MRVLVVVGALLAAASPLQAEVDVRVTGGRVSVQAVGAPVGEILEGIARRTGMRLASDSPLPRQTLTASFEDRTPAEAVLSVLEGLGLNYALVMDASGTRVDQLLILGTASVSSAAASPAGRPSPPGRLQRQPPPTQEEEVEMQQGQDDVADTMDDDLSQEEAGQQAGEAAAPVPQAPSILPPVPEYPSSPFSPRLPMPTPVPAATPQPSPPAPKRE